MLRWSRTLASTVVLAASALTGCTQYRDSGELVRHHFGYVKVITPAVHAPEAAVRALEVETYGLWVNVDTRARGEDAMGVGTGLGYHRDRRELIPLDCRVVVRLPTQDAIREFVAMLAELDSEGRGICAIQDSASR